MMTRRGIIHIHRPAMGAANETLFLQDLQVAPDGAVGNSHHLNEFCQRHKALHGKQFSFSCSPILDAKVCRHERFLSESWKNTRIIHFNRSGKQPKNGEFPVDILDGFLPHSFTPI